MTDKERINTVFAKAFLVFAVIIAAASFAFSVYLGGQEKILNKLASALERGDYKMWSECFPPDVTNQSAFDFWRADIMESLNVDNDGDFRAKYKIIAREHVSFDKNTVAAKLVTYSGDVSAEEIVVFDLRLSKGRWYAEVLEVVWQ
jgi:ketosteroid isomerase-like protein